MHPYVYVANCPCYAKILNGHDVHTIQCNFGDHLDNMLKPSKVIFYLCVLCSFIVNVVN